MDNFVNPNKVLFSDWFTKYKQEKDLVAPIQVIRVEEISKMLEDAWEAGFNAGFDDADNVNYHRQIERTTYNHDNDDEG